MAQYYQIVGQDQPIQTVTIEELRQYYPNITCLESSTGVQYVINNQEENGAQFQPQQQVLLTSEPQVVLNTGEAPQQIIVDQSQINYPQYSVPENEMVSDFQSSEINNAQQQIYYSSPPEQQMPHTPTTPLIAQGDQRLTNQQIINATPPRVTPQINQPINQAAVRPIVPQQQQLNLLQQRRLPGQNQQGAPSPNIQRTVPQQNPRIRLQYAPQMAQEQGPEGQRTSQQPQMPMEQDDSQFVVNDGRIMTLGQLKQELSQNQNQNPNPTQNQSQNQSQSQNQQENISVQQTNIATNQGVQTCVVKPYKHPAPKRNYRRPSAGAARGNRTKSRGGGPPNNRPPSDLSPQTLPAQQKPHPPYGKNLQQQQLKTTPGIQQALPHAQTPSPIRQMHHGAQPVVPHQIPQQTLQQNQMQQQQHQIQPHRQMGASNLMPPNMQQQQQQQPQSPYQQPPNGRLQPLIPLSPHVHNGHSLQSPAYSPPNSQGQQPYIDDSSSSLSDEYKESARMLVCLENGEQRLITFTVPKESCTVQDLLEQVGVPFNADTKILCVANPGNEIDYLVSVGAVNHLPFSMDTQQVLTVDSLSESQDYVVPQPGTEPPAEPPKSKSPEKPPEPPKEIPKFIAGHLAVCTHCGYLSEDFNRCQRCKTKLPEDVKSISSKTDQKLGEDKKQETPKVGTAKVPPVKPPAKSATSTPKAQSKAPRPKKQKPQDLEPVVLTLSSDEEDENGIKSGNASNLHLANRIIDNAITLSVIQKEPIITNDYDEIESDCLEERTLCGDNDDDLLSNRNMIATFIPCRTVRIGSYRFISKQEVTVTSLGVLIHVPAIGDPAEVYKIFLPMKYIVKVLGNFSKALPVLFIYVTPSLSKLIRKRLNMEKGSELYFDPLSKQEPYKRITLLPEVLCEETKGKLKEIFTAAPCRLLEELTAKEANDILIRTCPRDGDTPRTVTQANTSVSDIRQLLIYPPGKGGIAINTEDYLCLAQDQFLNDVIIDFYLKYLATDVLAPQMQEKVYIFSSFFYKRLTTKPTKASKRSNTYEVDPTLSPAEKRHCRVKNWTKNVNIFEKDYIIIPINENSHWFLSIICFPGLEGCRSMIDYNKIIKVPAKEKKKLNTITIGNTTITTVKAGSEQQVKQVEKLVKCEEEEGSDRDEAEGDESELEESEEELPTEEAPTEKKNQREPIKQPCILIFDSLSGGASRSRVVATLRDYLTCEYRAKLNTAKTFTKDNIKGACPKVPQQMNFTDCGLYVLQYVESFFKDPITDYHIPIKMLKNWFEEIIVTRKREEISKLIRELMFENNRDPSLLPDITFPTQNGELLSSNMDPHLSEGEEEEEDPDGRELQEPPVPGDKSENSLTRLQSLYSSDSSNPEQDSAKFTESSTPCVSTTSSSQNSLVSTTPFTVTNVTNASDRNVDASDAQKKSNRETMSYLKAKRINRHKNAETPDNKKQKTDN